MTSIHDPKFFTSDLIIKKLPKGLVSDVKGLVSDVKKKAKKENKTLRVFVAELLADVVNYRDGNGLPSSFYED